MRLHPSLGYQATFQHRHAKTLLCAAALLLAFAPAANARVITTVITGTIASGEDYNGLLGSATNLAGLPFTLTISFNDTVGAGGCGYDTACISGFAGSAFDVTGSTKTNPGTAVLKVENSTTDFGYTPAGYYGGGPSSYAHLDGTTSSNYLTWYIQDSSDSCGCVAAESVGGSVYPKQGAFPITTWNGVFSSTALAASPGGSMSFDTHHGTNAFEAFGNLIPSTITVTISPAPSTAEPSFAAMSSIPSGASAAGASFMSAVADFNGDGVMDIATTNNLDASISVLTGKGDGTFSTPVKYAVGKGPYGIAASDFDSDGKPDLAVVNGLDNTLNILFNKAGVFPANLVSTVGVGSEPFGVTAGDIDGDGKSDLVVTNYGSNSLSVMFSKTGFYPVTSYATGNAPFGTVVANLQSSTYPSVVQWNFEDNSLKTLISEGTVLYPSSTYSTGSNPFSGTTGDFNNDNWPDIAVANLGDNTVTVLMNKQSGALLPGVAYPVGNLPTSVVAVDLNGDGIVDLAVANLGDGTVSVLIGKGDGTFLPQVTYPAGVQPYSLQTADFNGDGLPDLLINNFFSPTLGVLLQTNPAAGSNIPKTPNKMRTMSSTPVKTTPLP